MNADQPSAPALSPQARRELLLGAWLDITNDRFVARIQELHDAGSLEAVDEAVNDYAGRYITALQASASGDPEAPQMMWQAVSAMADATLLEAVRLFGTVPAGVEG